MPPVAVLAPIALPLIAAGLLSLLRLGGVNFGRLVAGAGAIGAAASLLILWLAVRSTLELNLGSFGFGSSFELRVDAVTFAFGLMVMLPAAVMLTLQPRTWQEAAMASFGVAAAMAALEAGGLVGTALAGGVAATLAAVQLDTEHRSTPRPRWSVLLVAWLLLSLSGVILQVRGGTDAYAAVPVASFTAPVFALLASAALLSSGLAPWRMWPSQLWMRPSARAAGMTVATLYPLGFYLLVRAYELGNGTYPHPLFQVGLSALGVLIAIGAAARAQAALTQREFLAEAIPGIGGFALTALALGTPLGLAASVTMIATAAALTACLALLPDAPGRHSLVAIAAAVGLPPGLAFGARVLGLEAAFEAGGTLGVIGLGGAVAWAVWMVGAARALGLPASAGQGGDRGFPRLAAAISALALVAGPAMPAIQTAFANPAQADVMSAATGTLGGGLQSVVTVSTVVPALALFVPLLVIAVVAYLVTGLRFSEGQARPPVFVLPGSGLVARANLALRRAAVPDEYRSLLNLPAVESAAVSARPVLWFGALVALVFAVTRQ